MEKRTNPWVISTIILAGLCGFLIGCAVSQPRQVVTAEESAGKDYIYTTVAEGNGLFGVRFAVDDNPVVPEVFSLGGIGTVTGSFFNKPLKWVKVKSDY